MNETDNELPTPDTESKPAETFALIGHEIRTEIIKELVEAGESAFGELRSQIGTEVDPSQLHYHLDRLVGHFIDRGENGYHIRPEGLRLYQTLRAGSLNRQQEQFSFDPDFDCHTCQAPVEAGFDNGLVRVWCPEGPHLYGDDFLPIPLTAFVDDAESVSFSHLCKYINQKTLSIARGICPSCAHQLDPRFEANDALFHDVYIRFWCDLCSVGWPVSIGRAVLADPGLRSFCQDHGVDVLTTPYWELEFAATDEHVTVRSTDPREVELVVTFDGDTLELVVDGDLNIVERNRIDATDDGGTSSGRSATSSDTPTRSRERGETVDLPTTLACVQSIRHHRWPDGVACPRCDSPDTIKKGTTGKGAQRYRCQHCNRSFTDLTGTIFADRRLTLPEMFYIIREMDEKTPTQIAQPLERSYRSVLDFVHEVQDAPVEGAGVDRSIVCETDDISGTADDTGMS